jgi:hypothetical protein
MRWKALQLGDFRFDGLDAARHEQRQHGLQIGAGGEGAAFGRIRAPDHHALVVGLGFGDGLVQAGDDAGADGMHLGLDREDQHLVTLVPDAHRLVLEYRGAGGAAVGRTLAQNRRAEWLPGIDRERGARHIGLARRRPGTVGGVYPRASVEHPGRQRRGAQRLAGFDVFLDPVGDLLPAGGLPGLEGAELLAEAPAHGEVDVARVVGDGLQMHGDVVECVAENGPEELRLRVGRFAQGLHALGRSFSLRMRTTRSSALPPPATYWPVAKSRRCTSRPTFL